MEELDLVTRIKHLYKVDWDPHLSKDSRNLLRNTILAHITYSVGTNSLLFQVWQKPTTFRAEYERLGQAGFLRQEGTLSIIGYNPLEESIDLLDKAVLTALKTDAAQVLHRSRKHKGILDLNKEWARRLKYLGVAEGPLETVTFEKKISVCYRDVASKPTKLAKKKGYDMFTQIAKEISGSKVRFTFSFYKINPQIYAWA